MFMAIHSSSRRKPILLEAVLSLLLLGVGLWRSFGQ
jgi:hypothetical protein